MHSCTVFFTALHSQFHRPASAQRALTLPACTFATSPLTARNGMQELAIKCFRYYAGWSDKIHVRTHRLRLSVGLQLDLPTTP